MLFFLGNLRFAGLFATLKTMESAGGNDLCLIQINLVFRRRGAQVRGKFWEQVWIQIFASKSENADAGTKETPDCSCWINQKHHIDRQLTSYII